MEDELSELSAVRLAYKMVNYQCLEFSSESGLGLLSGLTLESGLALLSGLKELRVLDVRKTAHNIGVEELEWMHQNWPKLERIRGLESDRGGGPRLVLMGGWLFMLVA